MCYDLGHVDQQIAEVAGDFRLPCQRKDWLFPYSAERAVILANASMMDFPRSGQHSYRYWRVLPETSRAWKRTPPGLGERRFRCLLSSPHIHPDQCASFDVVQSCRHALGKMFRYLRVLKCFHSLSNSHQMLVFVSALLVRRTRSKTLKL